MISLTRFFVKPVKRMSTKFIIDALKKLTVTVVSAGNGLKKRFYSNFNLSSTVDSVEIEASSIIL